MKKLCSVSQFKLFLFLLHFTAITKIFFHRYNFNIPSLNKTSPSILPDELDK